LWPKFRGKSKASSRLVVGFQSVGEATPPASAVWYFNFNLGSSARSPQTTGFSRVVFQFQPRIEREIYGDHRLQPCGASILTYGSVDGDLG
jgi:hypothetical protein